VRYDPADRSRIELDRRAFVEHRGARERERDSERIVQGEKALGLASTATRSTRASDQHEPEAGELRIGDADRDLIAEVLSQHMADGRLTTDELEARLGALYTSQTRAQARSVLAGLPSLTPSGGERREGVLVLPAWVGAREAEVRDSPASTPVARPGAGAGAPVPTDGEMITAYRRWHAKAEKLKADKAAHQQAQASGDPREAALAFKLTISRGAEQNARGKLAQLRQRRPDWTVEEG
jgi:hypothetical protein